MYISSRKMANDDLCVNSELVQGGNNDTRDRLEENVLFTSVYFGIGLVVIVICI